MKTTEFLRESAEKYEYDDEVGMVKNNLHTMVRMGVEIAKSLKENEDIPEWCQEKIAVAKSMLVAVGDYMISQHEMGHQPEVPGFDVDQAEQQFAESLNEDAGATCSSSVAVAVETLGEKGSFSQKDLKKQFAGYTNRLKDGKQIKVEGGY